MPVISKLLLPNLNQPLLRIAFVDFISPLLKRLVIALIVSRAWHQGVIEGDRVDLLSKSISVIIDKHVHRVYFLFVLLIYLPVRKVYDLFFDVLAKFFSQLEDVPRNFPLRLPFYWLRLLLLLWILWIGLLRALGQCLSRGRLKLAQVLGSPRPDTILLHYFEVGPLVVAH